LSESYRSARYRTPHNIVRDRDPTLSLFTRLGGAAAIVTSGTITIRDADGTKIVDGDPIVPGSEGEATYALTAATVPSSLAFSCNWSVDWDLVYADGDQLFSRSAFLLRRPLHPVIDAQDIMNRHTDIVPAGILTAAEIQIHVDDAWGDIQGWLIADGHPPQKVLSAETLAEMHADHSSYKMFANLATYATGQAGRYATERDRYFKLARDNYGRLQLSEDANEDGTADGTTDSVVPLYGVVENFRGLAAS
jgi:hypothetical protein